MKPITFLRALLVSSAIAVSAFPAATNASNLSFGSLLSGSFTPAGSFATLSVTPAGFNVFNFSVTTNDLNSLFTKNSFIGSIAVDMNQTSGTKASGVSISNFIGSGVDGVSVKNGGGPGGGFEFRFDLGTGGGGKGGIHRLEGNESASWTVTFNSASAVGFSLPGFAMHVQGLTAAQGGSAWYTSSSGGSASAAPEPEIYAMMLSGLLLVGFARRRRAALAS